MKHLGDGFLLAFATAAEAVRAALALRDANRRKRRADPSIPAVRIAVHCGRPSVVGEDLIGHDVNLTSRLLGHCDPGQVLTTAEAKALAENEADMPAFSAAADIDVRGISNPVRTFTLA